jgi:hypothetical protein
MLPVFDFATIESAPIGDLPFKRRAAGKSALDELNKKKYLTVANFILGGFLDPENDSDDSDDSIFDVDSDDEIEEDDLEDQEEQETLDLMGLFYLQKVVAIEAPKTISFRRIERKHVTLDGYSDDECWRLLRFRKPDITKLMDLLLMPEFLISPARHRYPREFSMILFLRRMAYPGKLTDLEVEFGREYTSLSRSIFATLDWLNVHHSRRITDNLAFWMPYQQIFADAVARKTDVPPGYLNVNSFLDGTQKSMCRPSDGPDRPEDAQRMWYSGYYRAHGFKMQSMMYPCGKFS